MVQLQRPSAQLVSSYISFMEEMRLRGEKVWELSLPLPSETPEQFVARVLRYETHPDPGLVNETTYWGVFGNEVVGRIALRHVLNDQLKEFGGHIGYEVRPSFRRKGIAKQMLREILKTPKAQEIGRILLTCAPDNTASNKTILANGGVFEKTAYVERFQRDTNYYWIDLGGQ